MYLSGLTRADQRASQLLRPRRPDCPMQKIKTISGCVTHVYIYMYMFIDRYTYVHIQIYYICHPQLVEERVGLFGFVVLIAL